MIPYILFVILIFIFRGSKKPFYMFLVLLFFNVLRYDTGWDYMSYVDEVETWGMPGSNIMRYSFLWQWLFAFAQKVNMPHLAIAVPGFLTICIVYFAVVRLTQTKAEACDALTFYALWPYFFLGSFSTIRQSLGIAIGLLILLSALKRKYIWFVILLVLNILIHPSSIMCIFFAAFFLPDFKLKFWHMVLLIVGIFIALASIDLIIQNSPLASYEVYLNSTDSYGSKLSILLAIILIPTLMVRKQKLGNSGITDVCILALILLIITYVALDNSVTSRVADYYVILMIFVAPTYKFLFQDRALGNVLVIGGFTALFFYYLLSTQGAVQQGLATSPFVPYQWIFLR